MERHTVSRLIGAPPGYVGFDQGGLLTDGVDQHPHCVLLLDEIEKAHPDLFNVLLQVMDHGKLTDHNGKQVDFRNVILIMTTNAGAADLARQAFGFTRNRREGDDHEAINEFKTTNASADPALWQWRQMRPLGFAFSLAFYRRGLEALGLAFSPSFRFFVQETEPPYCLSFIRVDDELIAMEDQRVTQALRIWRGCREKDEWPSYSAEGYDIGLSERERTKEAVAEPQAEHLASEDAARDLKPTNLFPRRK